MGVLQTPALTSWPRRPLWCRGGELNPYELALTAPSRQRVCRFHHLGSWQEWQDSNPRPAVLETAALPTELHSFLTAQFYQQSPYSATARLDLHTDWCYSEIRHGCQVYTYILPAGWDGGLSGFLLWQPGQRPAGCFHLLFPCCNCLYSERYLCRGRQPGCQQLCPRYALVIAGLGALCPEPLFVHPQTGTYHQLTDRHTPLYRRGHLDYEAGSSGLAQPTFRFSRFRMASV